MPEVHVNGQPVDAKVKYLKGDHDLRAAEAALHQRANRDGYDTYGVRVDGKEALILSKSHRQITQADRLTVDGHLAEIVFVENEINTDVEWESSLSRSSSVSNLGRGLLLHATGTTGPLPGAPDYGLVEGVKETVTDQLAEKREE